MAAAQSREEAEYKIYYNAYRYGHYAISLRIALLLFSKSMSLRMNGESAQLPSGRINRNQALEAVVILLAPPRVAGD